MEAHYAILRAYVQVRKCHALHHHAIQFYCIIYHACSQVWKKVWATILIANLHWLHLFHESVHDHILIACHQSSLFKGILNIKLYSFYLIFTYIAFAVSIAAITSISNFQQSHFVAPTVILRFHADLLLPLQLFPSKFKQLASECCSPSLLLTEHLENLYKTL